MPFMIEVYASQNTFISRNQIYQYLLNTCNMQSQRRQWHPTPVLLPGKSHGRRSLVGCSPQGGQELDTTERLHFHFSLSCTGEGNGNPLQCSCLENPRDGGAWWAAVYGVTQSRTRLKRLSSNMQSTIVYGPCKHNEAGASVRFTGCDLPDHIMSLPVPEDFFPLDGRKDTWCGSYNKESPEG